MLDRIPNLSLPCAEFAPRNLTASLADPPARQSATRAAAAMSDAILAKRVQKDMRDLKKNPPEFVQAVAVKPTDLRNVYFKLGGLPAPYAGGEYIVQLMLPAKYPMMPPDIKMLTPSNRFKPDTNICTTFTSYHPDSWTPVYNFNALMISFVSFMLDDSETTHVGAVPAGERSPARRAELAAASAAFNVKYAKLFAENGTALARGGEGAAGAAGAAGVSA